MLESCPNDVGGFDWFHIEYDTLQGRPVPFSLSRRTGMVTPERDPFFSSLYLSILTFLDSIMYVNDQEEHTKRAHLYRVAMWWREVYKKHDAITPDGEFILAFDWETESFKWKPYKDIVPARINSVITDLLPKVARVALKEERSTAGAAFACLKQVYQMKWEARHARSGVERA